MREGDLISFSSGHRYLDPIEIYRYLEWVHKSGRLEKIPMLIYRQGTYGIVDLRISQLNQISSLLNLVLNSAVAAPAA